MPRLWGDLSPLCSARIRLGPLHAGLTREGRRCYQRSLPQLQRSIKSYDGSIPFPSWLLRVAGNQSIDALRRQRRGRQEVLGGGRGATEGGAVRAWAAT